MKRIAYAVLLMGGLMSASGMGSSDIVNWQSKVRKIKAQQYELEIKAAIAEGWYIYSMQMNDGSVIPVSVSLVEDTAAYELMGDVKEKATVHERLDPQFNSTIFYITGSAQYLQNIRRISKKPFTIRGAVTYMGCDPTMCLPPQTDSFAVRID